MGEYGYDYDSGEVVYDYGDGIATDDDGNTYLDVGDNFSVDLKSGDLHYMPKGSASADDGEFWLIVGVLASLACLLFVTMIFRGSASYLIHTLAAGALAVSSFSKCKRK